MPIMRVKILDRPIFVTNEVVKMETPFIWQEEFDAHIRAELQLVGCIRISGVSVVEPAPDLKPGINRVIRSGRNELRDTAILVRIRGCTELSENREIVCEGVPGKYRKAISVALILGT